MTGIEISSAPGATSWLLAATVVTLSGAGVLSAIAATLPSWTKQPTVKKYLVVLGTCVALLALGLLCTVGVARADQAAESAAVQTRAAIQDRYDVELPDDFDVDAAGTERTVVRDRDTGSALAVYVHNDGNRITLLAPGPDGPEGELGER